MRRAQARAGIAAAVVALLLTGAACTSAAPPDTAGATRAATALATGLAAGKLDVPVTGASQPAAQQELTSLTSGMADSKPDVSVDHVAVSGSRATARLHWSWALAGVGTAWTYTAPATLNRTHGAWRVRWQPAIVQPALRQGETLSVSRTTPTRGDILGAGGVRLVTDRPVVRLGIDKTKVPAGRTLRSARALARLVHVDVSSYARLVRASGSLAFVEALTLRTADATPKIRKAVAAIKGAAAIPGSMPLAPTHDFARALLGTVGPVTAEMLAAKNSPYVVGDEAGLSGLEARYDAALRGSAGALVSAVRPGGHSRVLFQVKAHDGADLRTTLDERLQRRAEADLAQVGPASALVAIRPSSGAILAAASGPGSNGYNTATYGQYAPGSTFKMVTALGLLRSGLTAGSPVPCTPTVVVDGKPFKNYADYPPGEMGTIALRTAFANSCNTAFISQRHRISDSTLQGAAAALGFGVDHDLGFPAYFGSVPRSASATEHAASMIGQGRVLASPMAMATVAASVARGSTVVPVLLPQNQIHDPGPAAPLKLPEIRQLRAMMRLVVTSGSGSVLADVPGAPVLAKTGTAEFGTGSPLPTHAWMVAVQGDLAVAVFVDRGQSGSGTAGPILERFLRAAGS